MRIQSYIGCRRVKMTWGRLATRGIILGAILSGVSKRLSITSEEIIGVSKERALVKARNLICYWAVQDLGMTMTADADI
ncbi:MAG: hypothetical protein FP816_13245 [Desulfobacteraceae bacterium]|nr:hypothetical protein [Desulfobacteraceae bacterium]